MERQTNGNLFEKTLSFEKLKNINVQKMIIKFGLKNNAL